MPAPREGPPPPGDRAALRLTARHTWCAGMPTGRHGRSGGGGPRTPNPQPHTQAPPASHDTAPAPPTTHRPRPRRGRTEGHADATAPTRPGAPAHRRATPAGGNISIIGLGDAQKPAQRPATPPSRPKEGGATHQPAPPPDRQASARDQPARPERPRPTQPPTTGRAGRGRGTQAQTTRPAPPEHRRRDTPVRAARETQTPENTARPGHPAEQRGAGDTIAKPPQPYFRDATARGFLPLTAEYALKRILEDCNAPSLDAASFT